MKKLKAFLHKRSSQKIIRVFYIGFLLFWLCTPIVAGIVNVVNHWDSTSVYACNYSGTHFISISLCVLGKFLGTGLWWGLMIFGALTVVGSIFYPVMLLILLPVTVYDYFFEKEELEDEEYTLPTVIIGLVMVFGFIFLLFWT